MLGNVQPVPISGKLTTLDAKGQTSEGKPIQAQSDCNQSCPLYSVSTALAYQLERTIKQGPTNFVLDIGAAVSFLSHDHWNRLGTTAIGWSQTGRC